MKYALLALLALIAILAVIETASAIVCEVAQGTFWPNSFVAADHYVSSLGALKFGFPGWLQSIALCIALSWFVPFTAVQYSKGLTVWAILFRGFAEIAHIFRGFAETVHRASKRFHDVCRSRQLNYR